MPTDTHTHPSLKALLHDIRLTWHSTSDDWLYRIAVFFTVLQPLWIFAGAVPSDIALSLTTLCFLIHCIRTKSWSWIRIPWIKAALILWGYFIMRSAWAEHPLDALGKSAASARFVLYAVALHVWVLRLAVVHRLLISICISVLGIALCDTLIQYFTGSNLTGNPLLIGYNGAIRLTGIFHDPKIGIVTVWLAFPALTALYSLSMRRGGWKRWTMSGMYLCAFVSCVFLTGERMAFLLALLGIVLWIALSANMRRSLWVMLPVVMMCIGLIATFVPDSFARQYRSTLHSIQHLPQSDYGVIWRSSLMIIEQHPMFGVGAKHFRVACPKERYAFSNNHSPFPRCNLHPHHLYLEWLTEAGCIGLGLFLWMLLSIGRVVYRNFAHHQHHPLYLGLTIAVLIRLWPISTATSFFVTWSAIPFWFMLGWLLALTHLQDKDAE